MFGLPNPYLIGAAVIAACVATGGVYLKGRSDGYSLGTAKGVTATMDQLEERGQINEEVRKLEECKLVLELNPDGVCGDSAD
jgi:hypothetical protein